MKAGGDWLALVVFSVTMLFLSVAVTAGEETGGVYRVKEEVQAADVAQFALWLDEASRQLNGGREMSEAIGLELRSLGDDEGELRQPLITARAAMDVGEGEVLWRVPKESLALFLPGGARQPLSDSASEVSQALQSVVADVESLLAMRLLPDQRALLSLLLLLHGDSLGVDEVGGVLPGQWSHWLHVLPPLFATPFYWSKAEVASIRGTQLYANTKQAKTLVKEDNVDILRHLHEAMPERYAKVRYNSASLKWAKAVWRSRVTSCDLFDEGSGETLHFECFHPLYELANYAVSPTVSIREADGLLELVALENIRHGEELVIGDSSELSDMQLLDYYGYLREDGLQDHVYSFGVGLDSSESMYGWKKELLSNKHLQDQQLYDLRATSAPPKELLYALRVYFMTIYESDELEPLFSMEPISLNNELEVFSAIGTTCARKLQKFPSSLVKQREELADVIAQVEALKSALVGDHSPALRSELASMERKQRGLVYATAEHEILLHHERYAAHMVEEVRASWDTRTFDVPTNQQVIL